MLRLFLCLLFGHVPLKLKVLDDCPIISVSDISGSLAKIEMCTRCGLVYWES